jgi:5'(3')-deoxyribonucleotidase
MNGPANILAQDQVRPEIYIDLDGVLADYAGEYRRRTGGDPEEKGKIKAARLKAHPHFYRNLPVLPDALELWSFLKPYEPSILSAASNFVPASRDDKHAWVAEHLHLPETKIIVVDYPNQKFKHCTGGAILIDDNAKNCWEWENACGIAILHTCAGETIEKLKGLVGRVHD